MINNIAELLFFLTVVWYGVFVKLVGLFICLLTNVH